MGLIGFWKVHRARRAIVSAIGGFVDETRRRLHPIPQYAWTTPHALGFLSMVITLITRHAVGGLNSSDLAMVQSESLGELLGIQDEFIGEEVATLSLSANSAFETGCLSAAEFFEMLSGGVPLHRPPGMPSFALIEQVPRGAASLDSASRFAELLVLWRENVDDPISRSGFTNG
jgi:hypothetical protein